VNWGRVFFGILIVAVGVLLLLGNMDVIDAGEAFARWWPLAIIVGGVLSFAANPSHWFFPLVLVLVGGAVLLQTTGVVDALGVLIPGFLILIGLLVILGRGVPSGAADSSSDDEVNSFNLFSGSELVSDSRQFQGGRIGAVFGGAEVDLRNAELAADASLDVFAAFGGVEISVPHGWRVDIRGFPIFGGFENSTSRDQLEADAPRLRIDATVFFGGLEVKH
jgi:hypothetical protein